MDIMVLLSILCYTIITASIFSKGRVIMNQMKDSIIDYFQFTIEGNLVRNRSIMDQLTKLQDCCSKVNRTISKAATTCGCIQINIVKQPYPAMCLDSSIDDLSSLMCTHLQGKLCDDCYEHLEREIGRTLFYLTSICNTFDMNLYDAFIRELKQTEILGKYSLR